MPDSSLEPGPWPLAPGPFPPSIVDNDAVGVQFQAQAAVPDALQQALQSPDEQQGHGERADAGQEVAVVPDCRRGEGVQRQQDDAEAKQQAGKQAQKHGQAQAAVLLVGVEDGGGVPSGGHEGDFSIG